MNILTSAALAAALLISSPWVAAADPWLVDAVVFAPADADGTPLWRNEDVLLPCNTLALREGGSLPAFGEDEPCQPARDDSPARQKLNAGIAGMTPALAAEADRLRAAGYVVLWSGSWRQAAPVGLQPVLVSAGNTRAGTLIGTLAVGGTEKVPEIRVDLALQAPADPRVDAENPAPRLARMNAVRRMKSGELQYIDHPLLGVVLRITAPAEDTGLRR